MTDHMMIPPESRLDMISLAEGLTRAGRLSAKDLVRLKSMRQMRLAPLPFLAEQKLADVSADGEILDMAALLEFLAQQTGLGVFDIDPLKIDTKAVAEVMSEAFAERHQILAVAVDDMTVTIASPGLPVGCVILNTQRDAPFAGYWQILGISRGTQKNSMLWHARFRVRAR